MLWKYLAESRLHKKSLFTDKKSRVNKLIHLFWSQIVLQTRCRNMIQYTKTEKKNMKSIKIILNARLINIDKKISNIFRLIQAIIDQRTPNTNDPEAPKS